MTDILVGQKWRYVGNGVRFFTCGKVYEIATEANGPDDRFTVTDDTGSPHYWLDNETFHQKFERADGPVITETVKRIVPGVYGRIEVLSGPTDMCPTAVQIEIHRTSCVAPHLWLDAAELRAAAATLTEIADALEQLK